MSDIAKRLTEIDRLASSDTRHKHLPSATVELVARMRIPYPSVFDPVFDLTNNKSRQKQKKKSRSNPL